MYYNETDKIHGVIDGVQYGQNARVDQLNHRIQERQLPDAPIRPQYDIRPVQTKYALFPIVDRRTPAHEPLITQSYLENPIEYNFCPNLRRGTVEYFVQNVDNESRLRNQFFAIQKGADQNVYVPSSKSDLYKVDVYGRQESQPFPTIAENYRWDHIPRPNISGDGIGSDIFNNCTRTQLRNTVTM